MEVLVGRPELAHTVLAQQRRDVSVVAATLPVAPPAMTMLRR